MADLDVFDLSYLSDAADGDLEFIQEVLDEYVAGTEALLAEATRAAAAHDFEALRRTAHSVRGASASVGALRVTATAERLEDVLRGRDMAAARVVLGELGVEFRAVQALLAQGGAPLLAT